MSDFDAIHLNSELIKKLTGKPFNEKLGLGLARYITLREDGSFHTAIVMLTQRARDGGESRYFGAYFGYAGGGTYADGYFRIREGKNPSAEAIPGGDLEDDMVPDHEILDALYSECTSLWEYEDDETLVPVLSGLGKLLVAERGGTTDGGDGIWVDPGFNGDFLSEVSRQWELTLHFNG